MTLLGELNNSIGWRTVPDAAHHLSRILGEDISDANLLLMALQRQMKLSVRFVNPVEARLVESISSEEWIYEEFPLVAAYQSCEVAASSEANRATFGLNADCGLFYQSDRNEYIKDVWNLPMIGNEKTRVEDEYQKLTTKHDVMLDCNSAAGCVLVESPEGQMYVLQELIGPTPYETPQGKGMTEEAYYPAHCLPDDSVLVVRASVLTALLERFGKEHGLIVGGIQEEIGNPTPYPQEKLPAPLLRHDDHLVWGYEAISKTINCHKDNVFTLHKKDGLPLFWSAAKPYSSFYQLVSWVENRKGKKRETAKNFIKTENPQEK